MFTFADGSRIWVNFASIEVQKYVPLKQVQHVQLEHDHIEVRYVPVSADQTNDYEGLKTYVRDVLRRDVRVSVREMDVIPRSAGGKFEDYVSLVS